MATYVLSRHLQPLLTDGSHVVDMGTGPAATLGLFLWRRTGCSVTCVDVHGPYVTSAREVVAHNGAPLEVVHSDLFDEVTVATDTVVFNPPYVPTSTGNRRGLRADSRSQWDGGADGTEVIQMFLVAVAGWGEALRAHVGVNRRHVATRQIVELIEAVPSLRLEGVAAHKMLPVTVFTFHNRSAVPAT